MHSLLELKKHLFISEPLSLLPSLVSLERCGCQDLSHLPHGLKWNFKIYGNILRMNQSNTEAKLPNRLTCVHPVLEDGAIVYSSSV